MDGNDDLSLLNPKKNEIVLTELKREFLRENLQPDHSTKVFQEDVTIKIDDIFNLNELIIEQLKKYSHAGFLVQVYVKFENKKQILFSSWSDFENYKWLDSSPIARIVITWKFNALFPGYENPQKHTLTVKLSNSMRADELFKMMFSGEFDEVDDIETNFFPVYAKVNFINRSLGDELLDTVGKWVEGLGECDVKKNKHVIKLKRHKRLVSQFINIITFCVLLYAMLTYFFGKLDNLEIVNVGSISLIQMKNILFNLFLVICFSYLSHRISLYIGKSLFSMLGNYGTTYIFSITKGDEKKLNKLKKESKYDLINIGFRTVGALVGNIVITIISTILLR
jgi:hypothetical protein